MTKVLCFLCCLMTVFVGQSKTLGETIYHQGLAKNTVDLGDGFDVSAQFFACANCHGSWGQGAQEGGVSAPNITQQQLIKPYVLASTQGRQRAAYDLNLFVRALNLGVDSSGTTLSHVMPRYDYSESQIKALWRTLHDLSRQSIVGVYDDLLNIGVVLGDKPHKAMVISILRAYFKQINQHGGVFQRQFRIVSDDQPEFAPNCCIVLLALQASDFPDWSIDVMRIAVFTSTRDVSITNNYPIFSLYPGQQQREEITQNYVQNFDGEVFRYEAKAPGIELVTKRGQAQYLALAQKSDESFDWVSEQLWMLSASQLLVHAINRVGRVIDVEKLIKTLSTVHDFHTHFGPALSFGPQQFVGSSGVLLKINDEKNWQWVED